jgi:hypothetical protein
VGCAIGYGDCDSNPDNGCETGTMDDPMRCGSCTTVCDAAQQCVGGRCMLECGTGVGDCDGNAANGCETNVLTSDDHCGRCGNHCQGAGRVCCNGVCRSGC